MLPISFGNSLPNEEISVQENPFLRCNDSLINLCARHFSCTQFLRSSLLWINWHQWNDLVFNDLQWFIEKICQVVWDTLHDYNRIEWKRTLSDLEKAPDMAYQDILNEFDSTWGVKGLIVTKSNLVVTWKVRPQMGIIS